MTFISVVIITDWSNLTFPSPTRPSKEEGGGGGVRTLPSENSPCFLAFTPCHHKGQVGRLAPVRRAAVGGASLGGLGFGIRTPPCFSARGAVQDSWQIQDGGPSGAGQELSAPFKPALAAFFVSYRLLRIKGDW